MRYITDFHIHSKYSRACSKNLVPEKLAEWAQYKGIDILGTGDFTHPLWFAELEEKLEPAENGLFRLKKKFDVPVDTADLPGVDRIRTFRPVRFLLTSEISSIYSQGGRVRRVHTIVVAPSFEVVRKLNKELANIGNLRADGRPILGLSARDLTQIVLEADPRCLIIPAHAWTPWFAVFGSKSGFDSLEECFGDMTPHIHAIETGLSSDPEMNWRLSALDSITLISCSDAHSLPNLGREATVFDLDQLSYDEIAAAIMSKDTKRIPSTIEFYPEEGKYHLDGHAACQVVMEPAETKRGSSKCPVCRKPLTIGVQHRVDDLADRPVGFRPTGVPESRHIVPLREIIADALGVGKQTKKVDHIYWPLLKNYGGEFDILLDQDLSDIARTTDERIIEGIRRVRGGQLSIQPGYDGVYGVVKVFDDAREPTPPPALF